MVRVIGKELSPIGIEFSPKEVGYLRQVLYNIGGDPLGPRGFFGKLDSILSDYPRSDHEVSGSIYWKDCKHK